MKEAISNFGAKVAQTAENAKETAEYFTSGQFWDEFVMKGLVIIFGTIVFIVLFHALFDSIYRFIRGLDVVLVGGVFVWFGIKIHDIPVICGMTKTLLLLGGGMIVIGILLFIIFRKWEQRKKRKIAEAYNAKETAKPKKKASESEGLTIAEPAVPADEDIKLEI